MNTLCCPHRMLLLALLVASSRYTASFAPSERSSAFLVGWARPSTPTWSSLRAGASGGGDRKFAVIVEAEIDPDRMGEFLELIENNAKETRKEPGCIRFDVLRSHEADNKFFFYELYRTASAIDYHKEQTHYSRWADFKESGGVLRSTTHKTDGEFIS